MTDCGTGDHAVEADSLLERGLLACALAFYGAAGALIEYGGPSGGTRPRLRWDLEGLANVRDAMAALEQRIAFARRAGVPTERIVRVTRLDRELVEEIVARQISASEPAGVR